MAVRGARIEIVEELVAAGAERADKDGDRAATDHDLFAIEIAALELGRGRVKILDGEGDLLPRGKLELLGREAMVLYRDRIGGPVFRRCRPNRGERDCRECQCPQNQYAHPTASLDLWSIVIANHSQCKCDVLSQMPR